MTPDVTPKIFTAHISSPIGTMRLAARDDRLIGCDFLDRLGPKDALPGAEERPDDPFLAQVRAQLEAWFAGQRRTFDVPCDLSAGTAFQQAVWLAIAEVPYGATTSYRALAEGLGAPKAVRAVGAATGRNPVSIIIPCHRILGSNGSLTGYAGGLDRKRWLLDHEGHGDRQLLLV